MLGAGDVEQLSPFLGPGGWGASAGSPDSRRLLGGDLAQVSREVCLPYLEPHHQRQYLPRASGLTHEQEGETGASCSFRPP